MATKKPDEGAEVTPIKPVRFGTGPVVVTLSKPVKHGIGDDAIEFTELAFDFEKLTGHDFEYAERHAQQDAGMVPIISNMLDSNFCAHLAARACGLEAATIKDMPARDYIKVTQEVQVFWTGLD
jgi:hypothetical protein